MSTGLKAGALSGVIDGVILAPISYYMVLLMKDEIISGIEASLPAGSPFTPQQLFDLVLIMVPIFAIIGGLIAGLILGAIYAWTYNKIPGKTPFLKGLVYGAILWVIFGLLLGLSNLLQYGIIPYLMSVAETLVASMVFAALLGVFYGRFTPKVAVPPPVPPAPAPPAAVPSIPSAPSERFCIHCGKSIPVDAKKCPHCGKRLA